MPLTSPISISDASSTAAGEPTNNLDILFFDKFLIDLRRRILMTADDDGIVIAPSQKILPIPTHFFKYVFFQRQIKCRIRGGNLYVNHLLHPFHPFQSAYAEML
jgi:hypothetical protein